MKRSPKTRNITPPTKPHSSTLLTALRRHHGLFVFLGASIAFATFIIRDIFKEGHKETLATVENEQRNALLRRRIDELGLKIARVSSGDKTNINDTDQTVTRIDEKAANVLEGV
jgi:hypothetical protein